MLTEGFPSDFKTKQQPIPDFTPPPPCQTLHPPPHHAQKTTTRVRYYACESLYNIAKVSREGFVTFFSEAFDAMFRLCADSEANVQNAVSFLDNLVKVGLGGVGGDSAEAVVDEGSWRVV